MLWLRIPALTIWSMLDLDLPTISLDLPAGTGLSQVSTLAGSICHEQAEWDAILGSALPKCQPDADGAEIIYAKRCEVLVENRSTCPLPEAHAYDHHDGDLSSAITTTSTLCVRSNPHETPRTVQVSEPVSWTQRGEYLLDFGVADTAGNKAHNLQFAVIMADTVPPDIVTLPSLLVKLESNTNWTRWHAIDYQHFAANDSYDGDVSDTMKVTSDSVQNGSAVLDLSTLGIHNVSVQANDFAAVFGASTTNNKQKLIVPIVVQDTIPPFVLCKETDGPSSCIKNASGAISCSNAKICASLAPINMNQSCSDPGAICLDFHDSLLPDQSMISTTAVLPNVTRAGGLLTYVCTDSSGNSANASRLVDAPTHTPNVDLTDSTAMNLEMHMKCGDVKNTNLIRQLLTNEVGYHVTDYADEPTCTVSLFYGNCQGKFQCLDNSGRWNKTCEGGNSTLLASFTNDNLDESSINEFIAPFYDQDAPFSDFVSTYGLKYHCSNYQGQSVARCRTLINVDSASCNPCAEATTGFMAVPAGCPLPPHHPQAPTAAPNTAEQSAVDDDLLLGIEAAVNTTATTRAETLIDDSPFIPLAMSCTNGSVEQRYPPTLALRNGIVQYQEASRQSDWFFYDGALCMDEVDGVLSATHTGFVNTSVLGRHLINYCCTNSANQTSTKQKIVFVRDMTCPVCHLDGVSTITVEASFPYVDQSVTCTDTFSSVTQYADYSMVDVEQQGTYKVTYYAVDAAGNSINGSSGHVCEACSKKDDVSYVRTVIVKDTLAPVLALSYAPKHLSIYSRPGSSVHDLITTTMSWQDDSALMNVRQPVRYALPHLLAATTLLFIVLSISIVYQKSQRSIAENAENAV